MAVARSGKGPLLLSNANRNRQGLRGLRSREHVALAVKNSPGFDHHAGGMDLTRHHALCLDLDPALGENDAIELPGNRHVIALDLTLDARGLTQNQAMRGNHVSLYVRVDAKYAGSFQRAFKSDALVEKAGEFLLLRIFCAFFGSPLHGFAPRTALGIYGKLDST